MKFRVEGDEIGGFSHHRKSKSTIDEVIPILIPQYASLVHHITVVEEGTFYYRNAVLNLKKRTQSICDETSAQFANLKSLRIIIPIYLVHGIREEGGPPSYEQWTEWDSMREDSDRCHKSIIQFFERLIERLLPDGIVLPDYTELCSECRIASSKGVLRSLCHSTKETR